ncbi:hypothetical protein WMC59_12835, partial [Staphylococcus delphini]|uniref:hypothetical protein n=1 Tax=Staphylococcus delphini TaxID=53344 RepID=UPI00374E6E4B
STTLTKPYNHIHHNTLFKKVKIGRSSSVMSFLINTPLTNRRKRDWDIDFSQSLSFYGHISINDDKTATNEDEWGVIIGCYGGVSIS